MLSTRSAPYPYGPSLLANTTLGFFGVIRQVQVIWPFVQKFIFNESLPLTFAAESMPLRLFGMNPSKRPEKNIL